jgi:uncharacterized protein YdaT
VVTVEHRVSAESSGSFSHHDNQLHSPSSEFSRADPLPFSTVDHFEHIAEDASRKEGCYFVSNTLETFFEEIDRSVDVFREIGI